MQTAGGRQGGEGFYEVVESALSKVEENLEIKEQLKGLITIPIEQVKYVNFAVGRRSGRCLGVICR